MTRLYTAFTAFQMPHVAGGNVIVIGALLHGDVHGEIAESLMSTPPFGQEDQSQFHPEFGYFCPTPQFHRVLRVAFLCSAIGGIVGAVTVWVVMSAGDADRRRAATFMDTTAVVATTGQGRHLDGAARTAAAREDLTTEKAAMDGCRKQAWPYRAAECGTQSGAAGETGKPVRVLRPDQLKQSAPAIVLAAPTAKEAKEAIQAAASAKADEAAKEKKESKAKARKRTNRQHRRTRTRDAVDERAYDIPYRRRYEARRWNDGWGWGW